MGLRTTGKNIIDRQISEALLIDQERSEWPIERFQSLVKTLTEKNEMLSIQNHAIYNFTSHKKFDLWQILTLMTMLYCLGTLC